VSIFEDGGDGVTMELILFYFFVNSPVLKGGAFGNLEFGRVVRANEVLYLI
jgi:hypothetical protein